MKTLKPAQLVLLFLQGALFSLYMRLFFRPTKEKEALFTPVTLVLVAVSTVGTTCFAFKFFTVGLLWAGVVTMVFKPRREDGVPSVSYVNVFLLTNRNLIILWFQGRKLHLGLCLSCKQVINSSFWTLRTCQQGSCEEVGAKEGILIGFFGVLVVSQVLAHLKLCTTPYSSYYLSLISR